MTIPEVLPSTKLFCVEGSSNKEYHASVEQKDCGYIVNFAYGPRGGTLKSGTKTSSPVDYEKAIDVYEKLVLEKTRKGYKEAGDSAVSFISGTELSNRQSNLLPQLSTAIDEASAIVLSSDNNWMAQEKMNGERRQYERKGNGEVLGINRKGQYVPVLDSILAELNHFLPSDSVIDGEQVGDLYYIFDLRRLSTTEYGIYGCEDRYKALKHLFLHTLDPHYKGPILLVPSAFTTEEKTTLFNEVMKSGGEGLVYKKKDSFYVHGKHGVKANHRKYKFWESATCVVLKQNDQRSVSLGVIKESQDSVGGLDHPSPEVVSVGNVTILPNFDIPNPGDLVEVRYLYYYPGGSLYQPIYQGVRTDKDIMDTLSSLKRKP